ncbi:MAG: S8 family serine peptidase [Phycisphaerales bacterium]|nr:S8 family serine peptidase [Phycisphaerales bacterium]
MVDWNRRQRRAAALMLVALAGSSFAAGPAGGRLDLRTGLVATTQANNLLAQAATPLPADLRVAVVQLDGPITPARRAALQAAGVVLFDYLPDFAYAADLSGADMARVRALDFVTWVGRFENEWKISPTLGAQPAQSTERQAVLARGLNPVQIVLWPNANIQQTLDALRAINGLSITEHDLVDREVIVTAEIPLAATASVVSLPGVRWIEDQPEITLRNQTVRWVDQSNVSNQVPIHSHGIRGQGQLIAVQDGRVDVNHCSFTDPEGDPIGPNHRKIEAYFTTTGADSHGTHVAGTALGDGGADNNLRGMAYQARLVYDIYSSVASTMNTKLTRNYNAGAAIHTNSWGNDGTTAYDALARTIDVFSYNNDDNLVIFAVTNTSTLKNPENSKNCLAVGASQDTPNQASFCSGGSGPTIDGRRKPEIYSPGCSTQSVAAGTACSSTSMTGTSMAAPSIAGCAALARQYFTDGFYPSGAANPNDGFIPSGALVKATLLNSAVDMTGVTGYPSNREGWGRVLLANSMVFSDGNRNIIIRDVRNTANNAMSTGDFIEFQFDVHTVSEPLRATLVWHDAPGALNANPAYVNNLNLTLTAPNGTYRGNVFSGGVSATGGSYDVANNVEMIYIPSPAVGTYTVRVDAAAVNSGTQGYALVVTGDLTEVVVNPCLPDWNNDGALDFFDVGGFLADFSAHAPQADLTGDGLYDFFDIQMFLQLMAVGCP